MSEKLYRLCSGMWVTIALCAALMHSLWVMPAFCFAVGFWLLADETTNDKE